MTALDQLEALLTACHEPEPEWPSPRPRTIAELERAGSIAGAWETRVSEARERFVDEFGPALLACARALEKAEPALRAWTPKGSVYADTVAALKMLESGG